MEFLQLPCGRYQFYRFTVRAIQVLPARHLECISVFNCLTIFIVEQNSHIPTVEEWSGIMAYDCAAVSADAEEAFLTLNVNLRDGTRFHPEAAAGFRVMELMRAYGLPIKAECGGACVCATCHVRVPVASSPQARGTLSSSGGRVWLERFIPAGAGNTFEAPPPPPPPPVHPRRRGEHNQRPSSPKPDRGSSPQARGTR